MRPVLGSTRVGGVTLGYSRTVKVDDSHTGSNVSSSITRVETRDS